MLSMENQLCTMEETVDERVQEEMSGFLKSREVVTFKEGRYTDDVRALYQDLMMQNVCANNVESVIRSVLKHLSQISDIRLPRKKFVKCMFLEG